MPASRPEQAVERAIYVQANNRIFGVVFWFLLLGPTGAWAFRVLDLLRHRAECEGGPGARPPEGAPTMDAVRALHGLLAWIPSRLLALGYVLAGNFEEAMAGWRNTRAGSGTVLCRRHGRKWWPGSGLRRRVAERSMSADAVEALDRIRGARSLVMRTLWMIWCPVIAVLTLYDWLT